MSWLITLGSAETDGDGWPGRIAHDTRGERSRRVPAHEARRGRRREFLRVGVRAVAAHQGSPGVITIRRRAVQPTKKMARIAGALYLSLLIPGPFSLIYIPNALIVPGNAAATAGKILASEMLFRLGIVAD